MAPIGENTVSTRAKNVVFRMLKLRARSEKEVSDKLKNKEFSNDEVNAAIEYFRKIRLLDDLEFARSWTRARQLRPFGINRIRHELRLKGISETIIKAVLSEANDTESEDKTVLGLAEKQAFKHKALDPQKRKQRVYGFLVRRGFNIDSILKAIKKI